MSPDRNYDVASMSDERLKLWFGLHVRRGAEVGLCDALGSVEYHRLWAEYLAAGRPRYIWLFIRARANVGPGDPEYQADRIEPVIGQEDAHDD